MGQSSKEVSNQHCDTGGMNIKIIANFLFASHWVGIYVEKLDILLISCIQPSIDAVLSFTLFEQRLHKSPVDLKFFVRTFVDLFNVLCPPWPALRPPWQARKSFWLVLRTPAWSLDTPGS